MVSQKGNSTKSTEAAASSAATPPPPKMAAQVGQQSKAAEVLHQTKKMPAASPVKKAIIGLAFVASIGYFTLCANKKPEASALDVAKVVTGTAIPQNTRPQK